MEGQFAYYENPDTKDQYFACMIADAMACCSQGLDFVLAGEHTYPDDYPAPDTEITVTGTLEMYEVDGFQYCRLCLLYTSFLRNGKSWFCVRLDSLDNKKYN